MTELVRPSVALHASWRAAVGEFGDDPVHGSGFWELTPADRQALTTVEFAALVDGLVAWSDPAVELEADRVHCDYLWIVDGGDAPELVGFLALRHTLNDVLLQEGGHIGYSVRPSRRREGHATRALAEGVRRAAGLGLARVLVTCDEDNLGSARVIESSGGVLEDVRRGRRRYWIDTERT